ncbi:hypothetical protein SVA_2596 [Sulfurifustis variabilis]|uniref:HEPN domain-containing protein n=1 Tax=Sulfurifustis variabilis TaxID=1675686 RepID=A0A1B4VB09_9GAMM|nr:hypothetical protein [Sulfurifustis variabilis]BAU49144.1 hypothetical protein SVA_2596 [Sulfurifustis variabilis]
MDPVKAWRHSFSAVKALALGRESVGDRLREAYFEHLKFISSNPDVPPALQDEHRELLGELGRLYPTRRVRKVDKDKAAQLAKRVVSFYDRLLKALASP